MTCNQYLAYKINFCHVNIIFVIIIYMEVIFHISNGDTIHERYDGEITISEIEDLFKAKYLTEATKIRFLYQSKILNPDDKLSSINYTHPKEIIVYPTPMLKPKQNIYDPRTQSSTKPSEAKDKTTSTKPNDVPKPAVAAKPNLPNQTTANQTPETSRSQVNDPNTPNKNITKDNDSQNSNSSSPQSQSSRQQSSSNPQKPNDNRNQQNANQNPQSQNRPISGVTPGPRPPSQQDLNKVRNQSVESVRKIILEKPNVSLYAVINSIAKTDPGLADKIRQNPRPFLAVMGIPYKVENGQIVIQNKD